MPPFDLQVVFSSVNVLILAGCFSKFLILRGEWITAFGCITFDSTRQEMALIFLSFGFADRYEVPIGEIEFQISVGMGAGKYLSSARETDVVKDCPVGIRASERVELEALVILCHRHQNEKHFAR